MTRAVCSMKFTLPDLVVTGASALQDQNIRNVARIEAWTIRRPFHVKRTCTNPTASLHARLRCQGASRAGWSLRYQAFS